MDTVQIIPLAGYGTRVMKRITPLAIGLLLGGCVDSPVHRTVKYNSVQGTMKRNNNALMSLSVGMSREEVRKTMGDPERSEGYGWGSAWLYRTAMTSGIYGTADSDFTPVVFDKDGKLVGWGRNFFTEHVKRYEIEVKQR